MKYVIYLLLLGICIPGMLNMIEWGLDFECRWWPLKLLPVVLLLIAFVTFGSVAYFRLW